MVARHIKEGNVQKGNEVFEIIVRQVATADQQFKILKMSTCTKAVKAFDNFVTYCQDLHNVVFSLIKMFRARCA